MIRNTSKLVGGHGINAPLTITATLILGTLAGAAQKTRTAGAPSSGPTSGNMPTLTIDTAPRNALVFPYGVQRFENFKEGASVTEIPGWQIVGSPSAVTATIVKDQGQPRIGMNSHGFLRVEDYGASLVDGFRTPPIQAPEPRDYTWTFDLRVDVPPVAGSQWPVIAVQHDGVGGFQDAWGVEITDAGANLFMTNTWGTAHSMPLFTYGGTTGVGQWISLRVLANLEENKLEAFVNGTAIGDLGFRPKSSTNLERQRLAYHGQGAGNAATVTLDEVGIGFGSGVCQDELLVDFEADEDGSALANGQAIATPDEYGGDITVSSSGPNNGAAIFDSDTGGPNDPSQDIDLLVDSGNILILQTNAATNPPIVGDVFPRPNDDEQGGAFGFGFPRYLTPLDIDLIDIDDRSEEGVILTLTDACGLTRTYTVPADWTGDNGVGTLDLTTLANQPGFNSVATAVEDPGYNGNGVVSMSIEMGGSGGIDNFAAIIPCVELTFEVEDDGTPCQAATPIVDGQDLSTAEFNVEVQTLTSAGPNLGAAAFDSTPGGPNDPGPDRDLLVNLGNIMILQNTTASTQTNPGIFDTPNDDQDGGEIILTFPGPVEAHWIDVIDFDEEDVDGIQIILEDSSGDTRTYTVPGGFTEDLLNDGPPAYRRLDLTTLANQPGFLATATAAEVGSFDPKDVVEITLDFGGPGGVDNLCFCP